MGVSYLVFPNLQKIHFLSFSERGTNLFPHLHLGYSLWVKDNKFMCTGFSLGAPCFKGKYIRVLVRSALYTLMVA